MRGVRGVLALHRLEEGGVHTGGKHGLWRPDERRSSVGAPVTDSVTTDLPPGSVFPSQSEPPVRRTRVFPRGCGHAPRVSVSPQAPAGGTVRGRGLLPGFSSLSDRGPGTFLGLGTHPWETGTSPCPSSVLQQEDRQQLDRRATYRGRQGAWARAGMVSRSPWPQ